MKSEEEIGARIAEYKELRSFADENVEQSGEAFHELYWRKRVSELTRQIWELEWVMS